MFTIKKKKFYSSPCQCKFPPKSQCSNYVMMVSGFTTLTSLSNKFEHRINSPGGKTFHGQTLIRKFCFFGLLWSIVILGQNRLADSSEGSAALPIVTRVSTCHMINGQSDWSKISHDWRCDVLGQTGLSPMTSKSSSNYAIWPYMEMYLLKKEINLIMRVTSESWARLSSSTLSWI